ncbi:MAG TPA: AbrB/MazE/SpoVT family DNA-binding domain-containing protein [Chloroflexota bacterium]|nr:AbrB/MazE/SpoVT family DNA-binding domain-containing protein [Chloroflexota bacterium]
MSHEAAKTDASGRVLLPAAFRRALRVQPGDDVILVLSADGALSVLPGRAAIRQAQALVRRYVPRDVSLVDELARERRAEAPAGNAETALALAGELDLPIYTPDSAWHELGPLAGVAVRRIR